VVGQGTLLVLIISLGCYEPHRRRLHVQVINRYPNQLYEVLRSRKTVLEKGPWILSGIRCTFLLAIEPAVVTLKLAPVRTVW